VVNEERIYWRVQSEIPERFRRGRYGRVFTLRENDAEVREDKLLASFEQPPGENGGGHVAELRERDACQRMR
jgi:hypothetical protein